VTVVVVNNRVIRLRGYSSIHSWHTHPKKSGRLVRWQSLQRCGGSNQTIPWNNIIVYVSVSLLIAFNCWLKYRLETSAKFSFLHLHCVLEADWPSCQHCFSSQQFNLPPSHCIVLKTILTYAIVLQLYSVQYLIMSDNCFVHDIFYI